MKEGETFHFDLRYRTETTEHPVKIKGNTICPRGVEYYPNVGVFGQYLIFIVYNFCVT